MAILANTKRLIQNINMSSLQELRSVQKPDQKVEDILASVIIICNFKKYLFFTLKF